MRFYVRLATCKSSVICSPTGDYCKAPFQRIGNGCYYISSEKVTGDAAAHVLCADRGAYLVNFETLEEAMRMKYELLVRKTGLIYYIGGRKMNRNIAGDEWKWFKHGETSNITGNNWNRTAMIFIVFFASFLVTVKGAPTADPCGFPYRRIGEGCYLIVNDTVSADTAFAKCLQRGLYLATFETINEAKLMQFALLTMNSGIHYYVGGRNINRYMPGGDWRWIKKNGDAIKMTYFAFDDGEPNGTLSVPQDCMCFYATRRYTFQAVWCENGGVLSGYICQRHI
ncbi:unnamed protein product [Mytilus edulis]|uniref:C-type lectin domain-containing protein n=1 Tax=Mytilus edulis TaxID=6550 RepID=A0A8S3TVM4_MYTED|nr:unnamed protein product [Mytilus edulis]